MIQILLVEDNADKRQKIEEIIFDSANISKGDLHIAKCVKEAKKLLYKNYYDLMILDLVLPNEMGDDATPKNGATFLEDIHTSPMIKPPIHIIGLSGYADFVTEYHEKFTKKLWHLIDYEAESTGWQDQLKSVIFHLVKTRERFIKEGLNKRLFDLAIITALPKPELEAVLKIENLIWKSFSVDNDITQYYETKIETTSGIKTVIAATADQMGMISSSYLATKMILYFKPQYLIMGGIAAGLRDRDLEFGDILIAEQSWDYGSGKIVEVAENSSGVPDIRFEPDTRPIQLSSGLKAKVNSFLLSKPELIDRIQNNWRGENPRTKLQVKLGPIASGSYVISSDSTLRDIKNQQRKLIGIEMETYGVYYAAEHSSEPKTQAISIKSVSDYGDGSKNDLYQKYAAYTSAQFIYEFIVNCL